jgi:chromosome segregation ATPase
MKGKTGIVVLVALCAVFGIGLLVRHLNAVKERDSLQASIKRLSEDVSATETKLNEQKKVNSVLDTNLAVRTTEVESFSNRLVSVSADLAKTEAEARAAAETAKAEVAKRDAKIAELEGQNDDLTKKMGDLNTALNGLEKQIDDAKQKLAASEGDREFLLKELKRLQAEKAELERQFNDLAVMREQVRKLKDELSIARRLEWIRRGLYGTEKGAEKLQKGFVAAGSQTNFDLNVEIRQDGGAKVVSPATNALPTNPPPANPTAPK